ncbi:hypothetical protein GGR51DRAFT_19401 [Nemania sp. FL0031]|nr:hypothetical protein GGR51DRAFT_19401 [Nemania sp. FL0031]
MSRKSDRKSEKAVENRYSLVGSDEESMSEVQEQEQSLLQGLLKRPSAGWGIPKSGQNHKYPRFLPVFSCNLCGLVTLLVVYLICTIISAYAYAAYYPSLTSEQPCVEKYPYSPILRQIHLPRGPKQMDARLAPNYSDPSTLIYSFPPSPEVDKAWRRITARSLIALTREDIVGIGKDPTTAVPMNPEWGLPDDTYLGSVDVFHQIHCLDTLRQGLITNYDYYFGKKWGFEPPIMFELHLRHCTNMVLQALMCHSDVEIVTNTWSEAQPWPYADFAVTKQCRDFELLLDWTESHSVDEAVKHFVDYQAPPGTVRMPEEPLLRKEMGVATGKDKNGDEVKLLHIKNCNA